MTLPDFQILHRSGSTYTRSGIPISFACRCADDNLIDRVIAEFQCLSCDEPFGFNIPIVREDGRLTRHLSCAIEGGGR